MTHDLHVAAVYLRFCESRPLEAANWISEDEYDFRRQKQIGDKLPDAVIRYPERIYAIEFGGAYEKQKLEAFHRWCAENQICYEIW